MLSAATIVATAVGLVLSSTEWGDRELSTWGDVRGLVVVVAGALFFGAGLMELAAGRLDVGLLPSVELLRIPDLAVVPGLAIAATHEVRSVLLVSKVPIREIRRVALEQPNACGCWRRGRGPTR